MQLTDLHDDETMDELDKQRAADMDERPIYITINITVVVQAHQEVRGQEGEEVAA